MVTCSFGMPLPLPSLKSEIVASTIETTPPWAVTTTWNDSYSLRAALMATVVALPGASVALIFCSGVAVHTSMLGTASTGRATRTSATPTNGFEPQSCLRLKRMRAALSWENGMGSFADACRAPMRQLRSCPIVPTSTTRARSSSR